MSFDAAIRRTRRIPPAAQTGYLMGVRLERYVALGLEKPRLSQRVRDRRATADPLRHRDRLSDVIGKLAEGAAHRGDLVAITG